MADLIDVPRLEPLADGTGHRVRVSYCGTRGRIRIAITDRDLATARAVALIAMGEVLTDAKQDAELARKLLDRAGAADDAGLTKVQNAITALASGARAKKRDAAPDPLRMTIRGLGEKWTTGKLAKEYPGQIKLKRTADDDAGRFEKHVYPIIGDKPVAAVTREDCDEVLRRMANGKRKLSPLTRRNVGQTLVRLLKMAVEPLRLIPRSPIPVPEAYLAVADYREKAKAELYPDEDRALMACAAVPLEYRLLWGALMREGMRENEALELRWCDLDLARGLLRLDENKTDDPREWALDPGVTRALTAWRERFRKEAEPTDLVFTEANGGPFVDKQLPRMLRIHLKAIKLHEQRPELFKTTETRLRIRVHDLRATFVTVALANGRSEEWITDRTGHRSHAMVRLYKRKGRKVRASAGELKDFVPLDVAIPELRPKVAPPSNPPSAGPEGLDRQVDSFEVQMGFEPTYAGFARRARRLYR